MLERYSNRIKDFGGSCSNVKYHYVKKLNISPYIFSFSLTDATGWKMYYPDISEMPKDWPGQESEDGLRVEHLRPDCELRIMFSKNFLFLYFRLGILFIQRTEEPQWHSRR